MRYNLATMTAIRHPAVAGTFNPAERLRQCVVCHEDIRPGASADVPRLLGWPGWAAPR
jgi:hypothetical protein